jgi:hypothetical protein
VAINIFEGARRIALLCAGATVIGTVIWSLTYEPYVSVAYSIDLPSSSFVRTLDSCPSHAGSHYFTTGISTGENISVDLCLLAMPFGEKNELLIPYKVDEQGMIWGAATYSSEVSEYERVLEKRFKIPSSDEKPIRAEASKRYKEEIIQAYGYLVVGLLVFGAFVWAIGWIVRGFLGIPRSMDKRPN